MRRPPEPRSPEEIRKDLERLEPAAERDYLQIMTYTEARLQQGIPYESQPCTADPVRGDGRDWKTKAHCQEPAPTTVRVFRVDGVGDEALLTGKQFRRMLEQFARDLGDHGDGRTIIS